MFTQKFKMFHFELLGSHTEYLSTSWDHGVIWVYLVEDKMQDRSLWTPVRRVHQVYQWVFVWKCFWGLEQQEKVFSVCALDKRTLISMTELTALSVCLHREREVYGSQAFCHLIVLDCYQYMSGSNSLLFTHCWTETTVMITVTRLPVVSLATTVDHKVFMSVSRSTCLCLCVCSQLQFLSNALISHTCCQ